MPFSVEISRRRLLAGSLVLAGSLLLPRSVFCQSLPPNQGERAISLYNLHTGEELKRMTYWADGEYLPDALERCNWLLRDYRCDEVHPIDPQLFDLVNRIRKKVCSSEPVQIISGYRTPATNQMLRTPGSGVAKHSLHMTGRALDIRIPGCDLKHLRQVAMAERVGGVGYYPKSDFVHIDTGRVRYW